MNHKFKLMPEIDEVAHILWTGTFFSDERADWCNRVWNRLGYTRLSAQLFTANSSD